ncbi:DUF3990 domain-containing protein [Parabacteroides timonensis]|uniref:DUF3990 domain-containing protein n=1 Tax=Parabacteroides timonensis TaxID=1871013 RepID=UPI00094E91DE|nr:DUF3990 domain-containing protein [Parabacteroides timonensis]
MKLYHGSINAVKKPSLSRGRKNTDFGKGFYTTTSYEQARKWSIIKRNREVEPDKTKAVVSVYEVDDNILSKDYRIRRFNGATLEWLEFVIGNRKGNKTELFDMVMGPVANDKLYATLLLYEQGTLTADATIEQLKTHALFDQLSFHSTEALKELRFLFSEEVE